MSSLNFVAKIGISNIRILRGNFFLKFESIFGSAENIFEFSVKIIFWRFEFLCQKPSSEFAIFRKDFEKNVKISREAKSFVKFC